MKPMRVLSLGAGVQSTTLLYMAIAGEIEPFQAAIFADTGWEPRAVYEHLEKLKPVIEAAEIPFHIVTAGNIRQDALDPDHRFASMPIYVRNPDGSAGMGRRQCTSEYKLKPVLLKQRELVGLKPRQRSKEHLMDSIVGISWDESNA
jgi:3'-phosphoadenosine 5'-phosphosulfate sulfotransferase (PAPS reductase)/FAD synthetase